MIRVGTLKRKKNTREHYDCVTPNFEEGNNKTYADDEFGNYKFKEEFDRDYRGTNKTIEDVLDDAFKLTGKPREEFEVSKWAYDENGERHPVEWKGIKRLDEAHGGAEVSIDFGHDPIGGHLRYHMLDIKDQARRVKEEDRWDIFL